MPTKKPQRKSTVSTDTESQEKPRLFHIYLIRQKGASLLRVSTYYHHKWGERPAAWASRRTAHMWGEKIAEERGGPFRVLLCQYEGCPVCRKHRKDSI